MGQVCHRQGLLWAKMSSYFYSSHGDHAQPFCTQNSLYDPGVAVVVTNEIFAPNDRIFSGQPVHNFRHAATSIHEEKLLPCDRCD